MKVVFSNLGEQHPMTASSDDTHNDLEDEKSCHQREFYTAVGGNALEFSQDCEGRTGILALIRRK